MNRSWLTGFALLAVAALPQVGFGQTSWSDSFPGGIPQQSWSLAANGPSGAAQTYGSGFTTLSGNGAGAVFASVSSPTFSGSTGVTIRATINPNASTQSVANGVLAATNLAFGNAYTATITMAGSGFLEIQRNSFGSATQIASTGSAFTPGFDGLSSYVLELVVAPNSSLITATQTADSAEAIKTLEAAKQFSDGLEARFTRQSRVDVDSEMASLIQLQTAYSANARVLSTAQSMWETLIGAVR